MSQDANTKKVTITLSNDLAARIAALGNTREGKTFEELVLQCVERGEYDITYRSNRNKVQYAQFKEWKRLQKGN